MPWRCVYMFGIALYSSQIGSEDCRKADDYLRDQLFVDSLTEHGNSDENGSMVQNRQHNVQLHPTDRTWLRAMYKQQGAFEYENRFCRRNIPKIHKKRNLYLFRSSPWHICQDQILRTNYSSNNTTSTRYGLFLEIDDLSRFATQRTRQCAMAPVYSSGDCADSQQSDQGHRSRLPLHLLLHCDGL